MARLVGSTVIQKAFAEDGPGGLARACSSGRVGRLAAICLAAACLAMGAEPAVVKGPGGAASSATGRRRHRRQAGGHRRQVVSIDSPLTIERVAIAKPGGDGSHRPDRGPDQRRRGR